MTHNIIVVDDEPHNLLLIETYLEGRGHAARYFLDPAAALAHLRAGGEADAILLDRMMPGMDGMAFLHAMRRMPRLSTVPVVLQTAAVQPAQIAEGLAAGAYYYLTKPFSREVMLAVLSRALADYAGPRASTGAAEAMATATARITSMALEFSTLADVRDISAFLAGLYPKPDAVMFGLRELMLNAVEHGNLGISYAEKTALVRQAGWEQEVERRLSLPEHRDKRARLRLERDSVTMTLTIEDDGPGFDWRRYQDFDPARARDPHGRGIAMSRRASFDDVTYIEPGNKVVCATRLNG